MFPHGPGFVLVFDYMLSDLAEVIRNAEKPLTEVKEILFDFLLYAICNCNFGSLLLSGASKELHDDASERRGLSP